ncbi:glycine cleavage system protein T [Saccharospirillum sp. MSK14-1]|uniref:glycine cleavage system aminomethyltransferase GcvT n=1 Tax=Saccharospirillum sp. MSK14-1 TaxID=1897632 RepID=UPI000D37CFC9|nr:glycine cleavage system aminomethyltransferase GcvT [Saccharospirillum sp. MSK14-1]PTY36062.1 glycine cleavage system protein T [Saccharospirillum sp. MSK14-1]
MSASPDNLNTTPLTDLHIELGARMVPFAGYSMPVQFPLGVKGEHLHTRTQAGLFDVSHMGQVKLTGPEVAAALETLVPVDVIDLPEGRQRYALFTNADGGILDDLMITHQGDGLYLVVNAACKAEDIAHLRANLPAEITVTELSDRALVALQGPKAVDVLARFQPAVHDLVFMDNQQLAIDGVDCFVSRSGYTGEDGYEISIPADSADALVRKLLAEPEVEPIGLGARDSLRLEGGLCLYGHDIDTTTTPAEASLIWAVSKARRNDGERPGGFPGAEVILGQIERKDAPRKRVGLLGQGRAPVREGTELFNADGDKIGVVTSGTFGPSVEAPVAMAYVDTAFSAIDNNIFAEVRGKKLPMTVAKMPFVAPGYVRS